MFEKALIRRSVLSDNALDLGLLAETLLFYQHVHCLVDHGSLVSLVKRIGIENLFRLIDEEHVRVTYCRELTAVVTNTVNGISTHDFGFISLVGHQDQKRKYSDEELVRYGIRLATGNEPNKRVVQKFLDKVPFRRLSEKREQSQSIPDWTRKDVADDEYVNAAICAVLKSRVPGYVAKPHEYFKIIQLSEGRFLVDTNFDFREINAKYHEYVSPEHSSITPAYLLTSLIDARADMFLAADYMSELVTAAPSTAVIKIKLEELLRRRTKSEAELHAFQELALNSGTALREVMNSEERSIDDLFVLLAKARRFKEWLSKINPDEGHLTHYYQQLSEDSWLQTLPAKTFRFVVFSAIGLGLGATMAGPVGASFGVGAGAIDAFLVDKILTGWRPSQFVRKHLKEFTNID